ncbi:MAG: hypothetical protein C0507_24565 [Cyanobacteria bacterium PR.3.49]|nr:hypothetical protein [Cyanobacteria bacterium PR.3.49]
MEDFSVPEGSKTSLDSMRALVERLRTGGIEGCKEDYPKFLFQHMKNEGFQNTSEEDQGKFSVWLNGFIERNGNAEVTKVLVSRWEYQIKTEEAGRLVVHPDPPPLYIEYNKFVNSFGVRFGGKQINDVFASLLNSEVNDSALQALDKSLDSLQVTLESLKEGASLEDCESLDALGDMFGGINAAQHAKYDFDRAASDALQKESLDKCRDVVIEALAYNRAWMMNEHEQLESHRVKATTRLNELISNYGMAAVDDQMRHRFRTMVAAMDSPDLSSMPAPEFQCSEEMDQAIKNLFGWDDLMEKYGRSDTSKFDD